jgi:hypothetical protein
MEKFIEVLIDEFVTEPAQLKKRHIKHVQTQVDGFMKHAVLKQKMLQREPLQATEATGDCFSQLLSEI